MGKIRLLDDSVINKIAAGEVVERPSSVVKELIENSLDAQAKAIVVELQGGGIDSITITDDGVGLAAEDAMLAVTRHATSKIASADDLFQVASMGFRGEALASIASVSHFTLASRRVDDKEGVRIHAKGGESWQKSEWHGPQGTMICVDQIFFNVPARKKFLKSASAELAQISEMVEALALAHPDVSFTLKNNGKEKFRAFAVPGAAQDKLWGEKILRARAQQIWGLEDIAGLSYAQADSPYGKMEALLSSPGQEKATAKQIFFYVNGRWVKDKVLHFGLMRGYQSHLLKGKFPFALVFLHCDPSLVDVNVHPAKTQLRFQYSSEVQALLGNAVRTSLRSGAWAVGSSSVPVPEASFSTKSSALSEELSIPPFPSPAFLEVDAGSRAKPWSFGEISKGGSKPTLGAGGATPKGAQMARPRWGLADRGFEMASAVAPRSASASNWEIAKSSKAAKFEASSNEVIKGTFAAPTILWDDAHWLGVFANCYIFFSYHDKLLAIDQHAFHERIIFERLKKDDSILMQVQPLLVFELIDLPATTVAALADKQDVLRECGIDFAIVADTGVELRSVPTILAGKDATQLLTELSELDFSLQGEAIHLLSCEPILATIACHSAVRAGESLSRQDWASLLQEAKQVDFFLNCPHGRRVFRFFERREVESWFDR